jgi:uncharacterized protein (TIGR03067 family)
MRGVIGFSLALTLAFATTSARAQNVGNLQGTYKLVSGEKGDMPVPSNHLDGVVRITKDTMTLHDKDNNEIYVIHYETEPTKDAARLTMTVTRSSWPTAVGSKAHGLIKAQGNKVTMIYDLKSGEYPSDFHPKGDNQLLFVMERTSEGAK